MVQGRPRMILIPRYRSQVNGLYMFVGWHGRELSPRVTLVSLFVFSGGGARARFDVAEASGMAQKIVARTSSKT